MMPARLKEGRPALVVTTGQGVFPYYFCGLIDAPQLGHGPLPALGAAFAIVGPRLQGGQVGDGDAHHFFGPLGVGVQAHGNDADGVGALALGGGVGHDGASAAGVLVGGVDLDGLVTGKRAHGVDLSVSRHPPVPVLDHARAAHSGPMRAFRRCAASSLWPGRVQLFKRVRGGQAGCARPPSTSSPAASVSAASQSATSSRGARSAGAQVPRGLHSRRLLGTSSPGRLMCTTPSGAGCTASP